MRVAMLLKRGPEDRNRVVSATFVNPMADPVGVATQEHLASPL